MLNFPLEDDVVITCPLCWCVLQAKRKIDLVYGGGNVGLMGLVSQTVFDGGCHVLGYYE